MFKTTHYKLLSATSFIVFLYTILQPISLILLLLTLVFVYLYLSRLFSELKRGNVSELVPKRLKRYLQQGKLVEYVGGLEIVKKTPILGYMLPLLKFQKTSIYQNREQQNKSMTESSLIKLDMNYQQQRYHNRKENLLLSTLSSEQKIISNKNNNRNNCLYHHNDEQQQAQDHNQNYNNNYTNSNKTFIVNKKINSNNNTKNTTNINISNNNNNNSPSLLLLSPPPSTTTTTTTSTHTKNKLAKRKSSLLLMKKKFAEQQQYLQQQQQTTSTDQRKTNNGCNKSINRIPHLNKSSVIITKPNNNINSHHNYHSNNSQSTTALLNSKSSLSLSSPSTTISQHPPPHPLKTVQEYLQALIWMMKRLLGLRKITSKLKRTSILKLAAITSVLWVGIVLQVKTDSKRGKSLFKTLKILIGVLTIFAALGVTTMLTWKVHKRITQGQQTSRKRPQLFLYQRK